MTLARLARVVIAKTGRRHMKREIAAGLFFFAFASAAQAAEADVKRCVCEGMQQNVALQGGARADCMNATQAVKVGSTENWADALGQVLHYATQTSKSAKIVLYCREDSNDRACRRETQRLEGAVANFSLPIEIEFLLEKEVIARCGRKAAREARETGSANIVPIW